MDSIVKQLEDDIANNKIKLPTQPEIAVQIREVETDPNLESKKIADIISKDPGLTARIIKIANSPLMRGKVHIDSLPAAINRLGFKFVCNTATGLAMEQIFQATHEVIDNWMYKVWNESSEVAAFSHVIAQNFTKTPCDVASLGGLMHKIGVLPILTYAQDHDELLEDEHKLYQLIEEFHPKLTQAILTTWEFPSDIIAIPTQLQKDPAKEETPITLIDILRVAIDLQSHEIVDKDELDKYKIPYTRLGIDPEAIDFEQNEHLREELAHAMSIYTRH